ncbi:MAG: zinc ribbon domain-containing protein [Acidobacteriota bacterium]|nr:zinc ribbon domain-containing protein [Acidobacteriota bacterium]
MALTLVEKKVCDACGADVRPSSLFCYNCGGAVAEKIPGEYLPNEAVDSLPKEEVKEVKQAANLASSDKEIVAANEPENSGQPIVQEEAKLKSAAGLRRRPKSVQKKTIEVVWEEHENAPNVWFISVAIVIMIFVAAILFLAMYLK